MDKIRMNDNLGYENDQLKRKNEQLENDIKEWNVRFSRLED